MSAAVASLVVFAVLLATPRVVRLGDQNESHRLLLRAALAGGAVAAGAALVQLSVSPILSAILVGTAAASWRAVRRSRVRNATRRRRARILAACEGLAADLAAGLAPNQALRSTSEDWPELRPVADAAEIGADVPAAFRTLSTVPGAEMLRVTAAAWDVAQRCGAGLADTIALAAETLRAQQATTRVVATELAAALATARLLALLPVGILVLGRGMGGDPFDFLLVTTAGQICLALGLVLAWSGSVWLERIAEQVETP